MNSAQAASQDKKLKQKLYYRKHYLKHKIEYLDRAAKWYKKNKIQHRDYIRTWRKNNKHKVKDSELKSNFGISLQDYNNLLIKQKNCCAICKIHRKNLLRDLSVDHDHSTGKIRGLLCLKCNTAIGMLNDDALIVNSALNYLRKHRD